MSLLQTNNISTLSPTQNPLNILATEILLNGEAIVPSIEIQEEGTGIAYKVKKINFIGTDVTVQETFQGSGVINVYVGLAPPPTFNINGFSVTPSILEFGATLTNPSFSYSTSPSPADTLSIDNGIGAATLPAGPFTYIGTFPSPLSSPGSKIFTMTGTLTGYPTAMATATTNWRSKIYWGALTATPATIKALTTLNYASMAGLGFNPVDSAFATSRNTTQTFNCTGGRYVCFMYPTSMGLGSPSQLQFGVFPIALDPSTNINTSITFTNQSGGVESYTALITDYQTGAALTVGVL